MSAKRSYSKRARYIPKELAHSISYLDLELLKQFLTDTGKIVSARVSKMPAKSQRALALAIKRARFLGLLPYCA